MCSDNVRSGWYSDDPSDPDYIPNVFTYKAEMDPERSERANTRQEYKFKSFPFNLSFLYVKIFFAHDTVFPPFWSGYLYQPKQYYNDSLNHIA